jgi:hypothetical protein
MKEGNVSRKTERSIGLRAFNAVCATILFVSGLYILFAGMQIVAVAALLCATVGVAIPVVLSGAGILEMLTGIAEAILDGIMAIFDAIASFFSGVLG